MPNRIVREGILSSEAVNELDWREECFFRRLLNVVDDWGRYDARAAILRSACYPLAIDRMGVSDVQGCLSRCVALGLVREYEAGGKSYIEVANFRQRTRSASKYPEPPWQTDDSHTTDKCQTDDSHMSVTCQSNVSRVSDRCQTSARLDGGGDGGVNNVAVVSSSTTVYPEATASGPAAPAAAAAADGFEEWKAAMCRAFPTLRGVARLSEKVEAVAREAYERMPGAADKAELLAAYLDDRTPMDRFRNKFYRPVSQIKFFENLEDVVRHAELWQRETGWGKEKPKPKPKPEAKPKGPDGSPATEAEKQEFLDNLRAMRASISGLAAKADFNNLTRNRRQMTPAEEAEAAAEREAILRRVKGGEEE